MRYLCIRCSTNGCRGGELSVEWFSGEDMCTRARTNRRTTVVELVQRTFRDTMVRDFPVMRLVKQETHGGARYGCAGLCGVSWSEWTISCQRGGQSST